MLPLLLPFFGLAFAEPYYAISDRVARDFLGDHALRNELTRALRARGLKLTLRDRSGDEQRVRPSASRLWPFAAASALVVLRDLSPGAELDTVLDVKEDGSLDLVTVWWEEDRLVLQQFHRPRSLVTEGPEEARLHQVHGVGPLVDGDRDWGPRGRGVIDDALGQLTTTERAALRNLPYHRRAVPAPELDPPPYPLAVFRRTRTSEGAHIEVYDLAVEPSRRFLGSPFEAHHPAVGVLVHELGHALSFAGQRRLNEVIASLPPGAERQAVEALWTQALILESPVVVAWVEAGGEAPTPYGQTSAEEGFAEAFMLHRTDPEALRRAAPRSFAWFERTDLGALVAGHLEEVDEAIAAAREATEQRAVQ